MNKKQEFIDFINDLLKTYNTSIPDTLTEYWEAFSQEKEKEKPLFTENGKMILQFLQTHNEKNLWKAREIAEGLFINSKTVSGSIRKLVNDEYVEKVSKDPVIYALTEKGKNVVFKDEVENENSN